MTSTTRRTMVDGNPVDYAVRDPNHAASPRCCHTGADPASISTDGNDTTPVVTETYFCEVYVPELVIVTGISLFNGSAVAGNVTTGLYKATGSFVAGSVSTSTAQAGTDSYQDFACTTPVTLVAGTYYVAVQFNNTSARFNSHLLGRFGAGKVTATTYGTMPSGVTPPITFTANLGPIASLY